jgi:type VI protein secretion system component VasK
LNSLILHKNNHMFSKGQWVFTILFVIAFIIALVYTYRKDLKLHQRYYKGSIWVLLAFISFIALIAAIKFFFK